MGSQGKLGWKKKREKSFGSHRRVYETDGRGIPYFEEVEIVNRIKNDIPTSISTGEYLAQQYIARMESQGEEPNPEVIEELKKMN